jgi:hypothetical protein
MSVHDHAAGDFGDVAQGESKYVCAVASQQLLSGDVASPTKPIRGVKLNGRVYTVDPL